MDHKTQTWKKKTDNRPIIIPEKTALLTLIKGEPLGEIFIIDDDKILGRCNGAAIILADSSISRRHLLIQRKNDHFIATDLNSTNGTQVNNKKISQPQTLNDGDKIRIADTVLKFSYQNTEDAHYHQKVRALIIKDDLTQIYNKRYFSETIEREFTCAKYNNTALSLILFDIDHFKRFNDQHGHQTGDFILTEMAATITPLIRNSDTFARFGGEEFAVILRETELAKASSIANRIRELIADTQFNYQDKNHRSSISLGVATSHASNNIGDHHQLISIADHYLYQAKHAGRNRVCFDNQQLQETP